jgi:proteasome lid subunit RPN8/RPN11
LNTKHCVTGIEEVARGSLSCTIVHPREVSKAALLANAAAIVLVHNHPSGDPTPSAEDIEITRRLREVGELMACSRPRLHVARARAVCRSGTTRSTSRSGVHSSPMTTPTKSGTETGEFHEADHRHGVPAPGYPTYPGAGPGGAWAPGAVIVAPPVVSGAVVCSDPSWCTFPSPLGPDIRSIPLEFEGLTALQMRVRDAVRAGEGRITSSRPMNV